MNNSTTYYLYAAGQEYELTQEIDVSSDLPYGIDKEYIEVIKPSGILRTWVESQSSSSSVRPDMKHGLTLKMEISDRLSSTPQGIGSISGPLTIDEAIKPYPNFDLERKEIAYAFSKADSAQSKLEKTGDTIR